MDGESKISPGFEIVPDPDKGHGGHQSGWLILKDGIPLFECTAGDTGPCWNIDNASTPFDATDDRTVIPMHLCDLDEAIAALTALRDSEAHRLNEQRWD
jgi:hypothetical protein